MPDESNPTETFEAPAGEIHRRYLQIAAHDIRGALANTRTSASFLLDPRLGLDEKAKRWAEMAVRNVDRALAQLQQFFEWAQYECGAMEAVIEEQPVLDILEAAAQKAVSNARGKDITLKTQLPPLLPHLPVDAELLALSADAFLDYSIAEAREGEELVFAGSWSGQMLTVSVTHPQPTLDESQWAQDPECHAVQEGRLGSRFRLALARCRIGLMGGHTGIQRNSEEARLYFCLPALQADEG